MAKSNEMIALEEQVFKDLERDDYTVEEFKNALNQGFDANACINDDEWYDASIKVTALMAALIFKKYEMVEPLLEAGADPNAESIIKNLKKTPLMFLLDCLKIASDPFSQPYVVSEEDVLKEIPVLLDAGAKVSLKNENEKTALDLARELGNSDLITLLETALEKEEQQKQDAFNSKAQKQAKKRKNDLQKMSTHKVPKPRRRTKGKNVK